MVTPGGVLGITPSTRQLWFWRDGAVHLQTDGGFTDGQIAGVLLPRTDIGGAHNVNALAQMIFLQICP